MKNKSIFWGLLTNYLQYIFSILLGIVLSPLVLKFAGREVMGGYAILLQVISYVALVDLGIGFSSSRFLAQSYAKGHEEFVKTCNIFRSVGILQSLVMAILYLVLSFYLQKIFHFSNKLTYDMRIGLYLLTVWTFISSPWSIYSGLLYTTNMMATQNIIDTIANLVKVLLAIVFVLMGWSIIGLMSAQIISQFIALTLKILYVNKKVGYIRFEFSFKFDDKFKEILYFSFNSFLISIAIRLVFSTDNLVIGYLFGPLAVTSYYLTFQPGNMLNQFILRITDNFTPSINIWFANKDMDKLRSSFLSLFRITFFLSVFMTWGICFCTRPIITLWVGNANYVPQPMSLWCGFFAASVVLGHVPNAFVMAVGKIKILSYFALFEGFLNLSLSLILGKQMGSHAIMLASAIANLPTTIFLFRKAISVLNCKKSFFSEICQIRYMVSIFLIPALWLISDRLFSSFNLLNNLVILKDSILLLLSFLPALWYMYYNLLKVNEREKLGKIFKISNK